MIKHLNNIRYPTAADVWNSLKKPGLPEKNNWNMLAIARQPERDRID
jgi:hypothetical protein